jgi:hypothetical protein
VSLGHKAGISAEKSGACRWQIRQRRLDRRLCVESFSGSVSGDGVQY